MDERPDNGSGDSDSDDGGIEYGTDRTKEQTIRAADSIIAKCQRYSSNLRNGIAEMMMSSTKEEQSREDKDSIVNQDRSSLTKMMKIML